VVWSDRVSDDKQENDGISYELGLPGGTTFRVVPPEVGVPVIRLWLEHDWPMSVQEGLELRDRLGWQPSPTDEMMFTTGHDLGGKDAYFIDLKGQANSFHMELASRIPKASTPPEAPDLVRQAYTQYVQVLTDLYGAAPPSTPRGATAPRSPPRGPCRAEPHFNSAPSGESSAPPWTRLPPTVRPRPNAATSRKKRRRRSSPLSPRHNPHQQRLGPRTPTRSPCTRTSTVERTTPTRIAMRSSRTRSPLTLTTTGTSTSASSTTAHQPAPAPSTASVTSTRVIEYQLSSKPSGWMRTA